MGAVALGVAASVAMAGPAMAATWNGSSFDLADTAFDGFSTGAFTLEDTGPSPDWFTANPDYSDLNANWDTDRGFADLTVGSTTESYEGADCDKTTDGSDEVAICPEETLNGLTVHPEIRYYGAESMERLVWVITNPTASAITATFATGYNSECDNNGYMTTSAGDSGSDSTSWDMNATTWTVQRGLTDPTTYDNERCGIEITAWQGPDASVKSVTSLTTELGDQSESFDVTVEPGKTIALAFFFANTWVSDGDTDANVADSTYTVNRAAAFTASVTWAGANLASWNDLTSKGLAADLDVVNWKAAPTPELPNTGVSAAQAGMLAGGAALLALAGVGVVVAMRRRANV